MKNEKSFTLIELLVVIAIIGLISSIVLVSMDLPKQRQKARIAKTLQFSQSIQSALGSEAVGIWEFDEGSGAIAKDRSGYGNNGTINGASFTDDTPQKVIGQSAGKYALSFDGVNDSVNAGNAANLSLTADFTIEAWIKPIAGALNGGIVTKGETTSDYLYTYVLSLRHYSGYLDFLGGNTAGTGRAWDLTFGVVTFGEWNHIVVLVSGAEAKAYINGISKGTAVATAGRYSNTDVVEIGKDPWGYFKGLIDEVRIYNRALSVGQIKKHYVEGLEKHSNLAIK